LHSSDETCKKAILFVHKKWIVVNDQISFDFDLYAPPDWQINSLQRWFDRLGINLSCSVATNQRVEQKNLDAQYVNYCLSLSRFFLELGGMPVFDSPSLRSIKKIDSTGPKYNIKALYPCVDFMPKLAYQTAINAAIKLVAWMVKTELSNNHSEECYNFIEINLIKPLRALIPSGKSTIPLLKVAHERNIPFFHLGLGIYQIGCGSQSRRLDRSVNELDSVIGSRLSQNKAATARLIRSAGLPAPVHLIVSSESEGLLAAKKIGYPVVVKALDLDRGEGVVVDVSDDVSLRLAFNEAIELSNIKKVIIERQVLGVCHRLFIANGKLLYAVKRLPMSVRGDGAQSIKQLINQEVLQQKEMPSWRRSGIKEIDDVAIKSIAKAGYTTDSILDEGILVPLRPIESTAWGGIDVDVTNCIHPDNLTIAIQSANIFGLNTAGIDIISPDISYPWHQNGGIINEVNFAPLFGGAEISRSYIPKFFSEFINGEGRIPIEIHETLLEAKNKQHQYIKKGMKCFLVASHETLDANLNKIYFPFDSIKKRVKALLYRLDVEAIVIYLG
jgi:cyanophycin synthetase